MPTSPSLYEEGTITLVNGEVDFSGTDTGFIVAGVAGGTLHVVAGGALYSAPIRAISGDGAGTLALPWQGPSVTDTAYVITRESAAAADALFVNNALVRVVRDLSLSALAPDGAGTLAERDALSPAPAEGYFWLRVEVGYDLALYRKEAAGWSGPHTLRGRAGLGEGGLSLPEGGAIGDVLVKTGVPDGDAEWQVARQLPPGGTAGQVAVKTGPGDGAAEWQDGRRLPIGGAAGQVAVKTGAGDGDIAYRDIVGAVAQADGVPTGAIFEEGSGTNGRYIKYASGFMVCYGRANLGSIDINVVHSGAIYRSAPIAFDYPAAFVGTPALQANVYELTYTAGWVGGVNPAGSTTTGRVFVMRGASATAIACQIDFVAIGRWFAP